jgi:hypothetical protein
MNYASLFLHTYTVLVGKVIFGELDSLLGREVVLVLQHHHNIAAS